MPSGKRTNLFTIILVVIVLVSGYVWYSYLKNRPASAVTSVQNGVQAGKEFVGLLKTLAAVRIDASFFSSPGFQSLKAGAGLPQTPSSRGRNNPFSSLR
ncbi:MAG: hypothetical protein Q8Q97_02640 [bacterium]|nr:hypothetical protein [bacterium]